MFYFTYQTYLAVQHDGVGVYTRRHVVTVDRAFSDVTAPCIVEDRRWTAHWLDTDLVKVAVPEQR